MADKTEFRKWLHQKENTNLEFKEAKNNFDLDHKLSDYCAALSNEGGGKLILGVEDKSRGICGTNAFCDNWNTIPHTLLQKIGLRVNVEEFFYEGKRVLIFSIPKHLPGQPVLSNKKYLMRAGESLVPMDSQTLRSIFAEIEPDFSSKTVPDFSLKDIDAQAFEKMRHLWANHVKRTEYKSFPPQKTLRNLGLLSKEGLNYGALVLIGKKEKIDALLPDSEIIFEWRSNHGKTSHDFRMTWREPFFAIFDEIWKVIDARNIRFPFQEGFVQREIFAFHEKVVREAILNAVAHRDYQARGRSIFIKASPEEFYIESPGGLISGVTLENILVTSAWRNRCIAEVFEKTHLVERSGQGMDDIFEITIREGKGKPDLSKTDSYSVRVQIPAQLKDKKFVMFLEKVLREKEITLSFDQILELENIRENQKTQNLFFRKEFIELGLIENIGKGRGSKYILSRKYYEHEGKLGKHTRLVGLSREEKKMLILKHLEKVKSKGARKRDFFDIFTEKITRKDLDNILQELRREGKIYATGKGPGSIWKVNQ